MSDIEPSLASSLADSFPDPIAILDTKGTILWCNSATYEASQLTPDEVVGHRFTKLTNLRARDIPRFVKTFASILRGTEIDPMKIEWKRKDGTLVQSEARIKTIELTNGKKVIQVITRDISNLKSAELAAREERDRAQQYLDVAGMIIVALDISGNITMLNRYGCDKLGISLKDAIGRSWFDEFVPESHRKRTKEEFNRILAKGSSIDTYENPIKTKKGEERFIRWHNSILRDEEGVVVGTLSSGEDITDYKIVEVALRESEEKHRLFFQNARVSLFRTDIETGMVLECNVMGAQLFGYSTPEDLEGQVKVSNHYANPEDRKKLIEELEKNGEVRSYLLQLARVDGSEIWVEISSVPYPEQRYLESVVIDVTDRHMAEEAVKASETRYRELIENLPAGVGIADLDERILMVNAEFCRILGYSRDEAIGLNVLDTIAPEDHETIISQTEERKTGKSSTYDATAIRKDGSRIRIGISAVPHRNNEGEIDGTIGLFLDVTESKRVQEELMVSEKRYRDLIAQLPLGIAIANQDEVVELANKAMAEILREDLTNLINTNMLDYIDPRYLDELKAQNERRGEGESSTYDIEMIRTDNQNRHIRIFAAPRYEADGSISGSVGIFEDISEQKLLESIRIQQEREIELYGSLLRHDLRNDLGLILSYVEAVQMLMEDPSEEVLSFTEAAIATVERMANLLKGFGRPQEVREVDLVEFIEEIATETQEAESGLKIAILPKDTKEKIRITAGGLLAMVLMNLFRNSSQHAGSNAKVTVRVERKDDHVEIIVVDNGPGIPEDLRDNLFQRGVSSKGEAGGLGLYLSREIMQKSGGSLTLMQSEVGKGATFQILIPLQD
jgi:two-component system NtrC family sensor kinase